MTYLPSSEPFGTRLYYKQAYEELLVKWEAELQAAKNDYERYKQLEAENERLQSTIDFAHIVASRVEAERDTAELAYANECATNICLKAEVDKLYAELSEADKADMEVRAEVTVLKKDIELLREANGNFAMRNFELEAYVKKLENEVIRLEDKTDDLRKRAATYIKAYDEAIQKARGR